MGPVFFRLLLYLCRFRLHFGLWNGLKIDIWMAQRVPLTLHCKRIACQTLISAQSRMHLRESGDYGRLINLGNSFICGVFRVWHVDMLFFSLWCVCVCVCLCMCVRACDCVCAWVENNQLANPSTALCPFTSKLGGLKGDDCSSCKILCKQRRYKCAELRKWTWFN